MLGRRRRVRARTACIPCQVRKRKCSGTEPCSTCARLKSPCHYLVGQEMIRLAHPPSNISFPRPDADGMRPRPLDVRTADEPDQSQRLSVAEANSGAAFARKLGLKADPELAPKLNMLAWNAGLRYSTSQSSLLGSTGPYAPSSIVNVISHDEMTFFSAVYFEKVSPYYPFLDRRDVSSLISQTWFPTSTKPAHLGSGEATLCGIAALGCLFSRREPSRTESRLLDSARAILEHHLQSHTPSIEVITAWVLRVSYLRIAGTPQVTWLASCTLMHLIEAAGLHMEPFLGTVRDREFDGTTPETCRELFGITRHFNLWMSFELGRTRVTFPAATTTLPSTSNATPNIFNFLALSESLDPEQAKDVPALTQALVDTMSIADLPAPMILTQMNLILCIQRRLLSLNAALSGEMLDQFLHMVQKALQATRENIASHSPWHQVANVPFQIICALLSIDNGAAIILLSEAMRTLREVATSYDTEVMREAYDTALLLIKLHQRRKDLDAQALNAVIEAEVHRSRYQSDVQSVDAEPNSVGQSHDYWPNNMAHGLDEFELDPLFLMADLPPMPPNNT